MGALGSGWLTVREIAWPSGFSLQQGPELAVVDPQGRVGSGGDPVTICMLDGVEYPLAPR